MADILEIDPYVPEYPALKQAAQLLEQGKLIVIPTDSVYTIAGKLGHKDSIPALQKIKGGKANFSIMLTHIREISDYVSQIDRNVFRVMNKALPGPYTFILPANAKVSRMFDGGKKKDVGIRIPSHQVPLALMEMISGPLVCTSVNDEDDIIEYTTDPSEIAMNLDHLISLVLDAGYGSNIASTVIDCTSGSPEVIREGAGKIDDLL